MRAFTLSDFDFDLPPELVAQHPASERSASRLLDGTGSAPVDRIFNQLPALLRQGDLLVFNDTRVVKARLFGEKPTGGKLELLVERVLQGHEVVAHMKVSKKPPVVALMSRVFPEPTLMVLKLPPLLHWTLFTLSAPLLIDGS